MCIPNPDKFDGYEHSCSIENQEIQTKVRKRFNRETHPRTPNIHELNHEQHVNTAAKIPSSIWSVFA